MSTMQTPPPDAPVPPGPPERRCPRCGSALSPDQEWCLACGAAAGTEVVEAQGWRVPLYLGGGLAALAVIGVILAIVALASQKEEVAPNAKASPTPSAVGGTAPLPTTTPIPTPSVDPSLTPTPDPGLTPTPDPGITPTPDPNEDPSNTEDGGTASTSFSGWSGTDGWTIIIESADSLDAAEQVAGDAEAAGHTVGILESSEFSSLNGGYWVVFSGEYATKSEAEDDLEALKSDYSDAYVKEDQRSKPRPPGLEPFHGAPGERVDVDRDRVRARRGPVHEHGHDRRHRQAERVQVVAALEHDADGRADAVGRSPQGCRHAREPRLGHAAGRQRVVAVGVEPGRDQHELRLPRPDQPAGHVLDQRPVRRVPAAAGHRQVDGEALAGARSHVRGRAGPRVHRVLVDRDEQDVGVGVEDVVGPVAVVDVPVDDHHAREAVRRGRPPRGDRDVAEEAEPHRPRRLGVMAGRTQRAHAHVRLAAQQRVDQRHRAARGPQRGTERAGHRVRVLIDRPAPGGAQLLHEGHVGLRVHQVQQRALDRGRLHPLRPEPAVRAHLRLQRPDPRRPLRMPGHVVGEDVVVAQPDRAA